MAMEKASKPLNHGIVTDNCVELIGRNPKKFTNSKNGVQFDPEILPSVGPDKGITVCFWIYVESHVNGWGAVFHCGPDPHRTPSTWIHSGTTRVHVRVTTKKNTNEGMDSRSSVFNVKTWHHASYVLHENLMLFYVDGRVVVSYVLDGEPVYASGSQSFFVGHDTQFLSFNGQLKSFRYYSFALSKSQVLEDMENAEPICTTDVLTGKVRSTYEDLLNDPTYSDVTFLVDGTKIFGHKCILSAGSLYFRQLLSGSMQKGSSMSEVSITGTSAETFLALLRYLYIGEIPTNPEEVIKLMVAADYFSVERKLFNVCKDTLKGKLSVTNACQLLRIADGFVASVYSESPVSMILTFMSKNYASLVDRDDLYDLPKHLLKKFLKFSSTRITNE